jgi:hypothetical protein
MAIVQAVARKAGRELWSDTEIFQRHPTAAAKIDRVAEQLHVEAGFVEGSVAFSWEYLSPVITGRSAGQLVGSDRLFANYSRYINNTSLFRVSWKTDDRDGVPSERPRDAPPPPPAASLAPQRRLD